MEVQRLRELGKKWLVDSCPDMQALGHILLDAVGEIELLGLELRGANRLAYCCAKAIQRGAVLTRSPIDDALLDFIKIGHVDGPRDVPTWVDQYESDLAKEPNL